MHGVKEGGRVDDGKDRGEGRTLGHADWLVPFVRKEVVESEANFPICKEGPNPGSNGGVKAHSGNDSCKAIVINVIEKSFHVKQKHAAFEAKAMCRLDVVKEGKARIQAGREAPSTKLGGRDELVFHDVVLESLGDHLLQQFGHGLEQGDRPVSLGECVVRFVWLGYDDHDGGLPSRRVITKGKAGVEDGGQGVIDVTPPLFEEFPADA